MYYLLYELFFFFNQINTNCENNYMATDNYHFFFGGWGVGHELQVVITMASEP